MTTYSGDVDASQTWAHLAEKPDSILVDVRTMAEWNFVGIPDLAQLNKTVIFEEWQHFPHMEVNTAFAANVEQAIFECGGNRNSSIYFLCRSGVRSMSAASALTAKGFQHCFNVSGGFEGPPDENRHRGVIDGWKAKNLPWLQK